MATPLPEDQITAMRQLILDGRKIEAIKVYRDVTGFGLKEAKDAVEELETTLRNRTPDQFKSPPAKGCLGAAVALAIGVLTVAYWLGQA